MSLGHVMSENQKLGDKGDEVTEVSLKVLNEFKRVQMPLNCISSDYLTKTPIYTKGDEVEELGDEVSKIWISTKEAVALLGIARQNIHKNKNFVNKVVTGKSGRETLWLLSSLPQEIQDKYYTFTKIQQSHGLSNGNVVTSDGQSLNISCNKKNPSFFFDISPPLGDVTGELHGCDQSESCDKEGYSTGRFSLSPQKRCPSTLNNSGGFLDFQPPQSIVSESVEPNSCQDLNTTSVNHGSYFKDSLLPHLFGGGLPNSTNTTTVSLYSKEAENVALARLAAVNKWRKFREPFKNNVTNGNETVVQKMCNSKNEQNLGRILGLLQDKKITIVQLAELRNCHKNTILNQIKNGDITAVFGKSRGQFGQKYLIPVASLSLDIQLQYFQENMPVLAQSGTSLTFIENSSNNYKVNKELKAEQDDNFVALYNSGYWKELYNLTGNISKGTLYRWNRLLEQSNNDYTSLIPAYSYSSEIELRSSLSEEEKNIILGLLLNPAKLKTRTAYNYAVMILAAGGMEAKGFNVYRRFIENYKNQNKDVWILTREGEKALCDSVIPYIPRDVSLLEVGECLIADGHKLDFLVINPNTGKACRAVMVAFQDWKSLDIAGFDIMVTENTQCVDSALRNSIIRLGKIPSFCYLDNGKSFKNKFFGGTANFDEAHFMGVYAQLGITTIFATPYNAKAKRIERFFETFTSTCEKLLPNYIGNNIQNQPAWMRRNEKFHKEWHQDSKVLTIEQAVGFINWWLDNYYRKLECNNQKGWSIGNVFQSGIGSGVNLESLNHLMMAKEIRSIRQNGISLFGLNYWNDRLFGFDQKVQVRYSIQDLTYIYVYSEKNEFICKAELVEKIHPIATHLGSDLDRNNLKNAIKTQRKLKNQTIKKAKNQIRQSSDYMGLLPDFSKAELPASHTPEIDIIDYDNGVIDMNQRYIDEYERAVAEGRINRIS